MPDSGERLRVLRLISRMNVGGPAWQVAALTERLDPERYVTRLVTGQIGAGEADYLSLRAPNLAVRMVPSLGRSVNGAHDAHALTAIISEIRQFQPHIVHTHTAKAGLLGRIAARICRVPATVHTFHGHLLHGYFSPHVTGVLRLQERHLARTTTRLVAVGERVRTELVEAGIGTLEQYAVIPPGVALGRLPPKALARRSLGLPASGPLALFVGRMTAVKRPERFVQVAALLHRYHPNATFAMVGDGPLLAVVRETAVRLRSPISLLGWRSDVETLYSAADVVVLTSDNEGMPVSLIEASMAGRPCVTTDVGSAAEVVLDGDTGFVTSTDTSDIAAAVGRLLSEAEIRERMGAAAGRHARACFHVSRLVSDTQDLYDDVVRQGQHRGLVLAGTPSRGSFECRVPCGTPSS